MGNFNKTFQDLAIHDCKKNQCKWWNKQSVSKFARSQETVLKIQCNSTHTAYIWLWKAKDVGIASDGNFSSYLIGRTWYNHFRSFSMGGNGNNTIYPPKYAHGRSLRQILDKITKWHFLRTSNEVIWPKIFLKSMHGLGHGLKSAILAILQEIGQLAGLACPLSAALHFRP